MISADELQAKQGACNDDREHSCPKPGPSKVLSAVACKSVDGARCFGSDMLAGPENVVEPSAFCRGADFSAGYSRVAVLVFINGGSTVRRYFFDGCDEAVPVTRNGDDVAMIVRAFIQCSPQRRDVTREVILFDHAITPHEAHQLIFIENRLTIFQESEQYIECS